jgi:hypothetical protein
VDVYPNPVRERAVLRFALPDPAHVRLDLVDASGRLVATLLEGARGAGAHEAAFDGAGLPPGVYFCRLTAGPRRAVHPVLLLE